MDYNAFAVIVWRFPNRFVVFVFFAFVFAPGLFFNTLFHAGATVIKREYRAPEVWEERPAR